MKIQYGRATFIFASAVSAGSRAFYGLMAAGTQTSRFYGSFMAGGNVVTRLYLRDRWEDPNVIWITVRTPDEETGRRGHARGGIN